MGLGGRGEIVPLDEGVDRGNQRVIYGETKKRKKENGGGREQQQQHKTEGLASSRMCAFKS